MMMVPEEADLEGYEDEDDYEERDLGRRSAAERLDTHREEEEEQEERRGFFRKKKGDEDMESETAPILSVEATRKSARSVRNLPAAAQGSSKQSEVKVVSSPRSVRNLPAAGSFKQTEVRMITPLTYDEASEVVSLLLEGKVVVLNLERIRVNLGQSIIDFTSGACYAMGGELKAISKKIFIASPHHVDLSGDFMSILTSNSPMDFSLLNLNS